MDSIWRYQLISHVVLVLGESLFVHFHARCGRECFVTCGSQNGFLGVDVVSHVGGTLPKMWVSLHAVHRGQFMGNDRMISRALIRSAVEERCHWLCLVDLGIIEDCIHYILLWYLMLQASLFPLLEVVRSVQLRVLAHGPHANHFTLSRESASQVLWIRAISCLVHKHCLTLEASNWFGIVICLEHSWKAIERMIMRYRILFVVA